jgi:hypothetical protein
MTKQEDLTAGEMELAAIRRERRVSKPTKAEIVDAALALVRLMALADDGVLDAAHCRIAQLACDSRFAAELEPLNGVCLAFTAAAKQRAYTVVKGS